MKQYDFTVLRQKIDSPENVGFVSGSAEIYEAVFRFDETWEGFSRTAVFECAGQGREQLLVNDRCIIPWEILHAGAYLRIGICGVKGSMRMPTVYSAPMFVMRGAEPSEAAREHSPDVFDQIAEIGTQVAEARTQWENMSAEAETLPAGAEATAEYSDGTLRLSIPSGHQGPAGPQGLKGDTGATGPAGADGEDGITPTIGANGNWFIGNTDTGKPSRGATGAPGTTGPAGPKGDTGDAFTYADFTPEQLAALKGPKGDTGATGAQGERGIQGPSGYTPVRGTDYWTESDRQTIVNETLAALPTYNGEVI